MKARTAHLELQLSHGNYGVQIGKGLSSELISFIRTRKSSKVVLISDRRLKSARASLSRTLKGAGFDFSEIAVKAGEQLKEIDSIYPLYGELIKSGADRDTLIIALGGGSIGDAVGFVAATYLRGIDWVGLPTTLLAQVDSSVGGKTGINHRNGKNLIGAFHQAKLVLCDLDYLSTLGPRELTSGLGEIVKYALAFDSQFFKELVKNTSKKGELNPKFLAAAIHSSLQWKLKAVVGDEFDRKGVREVLNFGHTFGHALETLTDYRRYQHGEAVIWGMRFALALSLVRKKLDQAEFEEMNEFLLRLGVPGLPKKIEARDYFRVMKKDKKSSQGLLRFVLLDRLGHSISDSGVNESDLLQAYELITAKANRLATPKKKVP